MPRVCDSSSWLAQTPAPTAPAPMMTAAAAVTMTMRLLLLLLSMLANLLWLMGRGSRVER